MNNYDQEQIHTSHINYYNTTYYMYTCKFGLNHLSDEIFNLFKHIN